MINYSKSKIYAIRNMHDDSIIYVGGTLSNIKRRYWNHKCNKHDILYKLTKEQNIDWRYLKIDHIKDYTSCSDRHDLRSSAKVIEQYIQQGRYDLMQLYLDNLIL